ncbi:hypothetical protein FNV43_RR08239 [Rhamnella rubrinervis]|uniref:Uncharacterized protein n=1 Tax=Rhamnella rubrinervis TaxID=2594499 RepID=A0A8K0HGR1_9ROSA|nr:hypothetical protein FNV43_RR08239 [Rhamnella rubrinervis]
MPIKVVNPGPFKALAQYSLGEIPICLQVKFLTQILTPKKGNKRTFGCKDPLPVHLTTRLSRFGIEFEYRLLAESRLRCSKKTFLPLAFFYSDTRFLPPSSLWIEPSYETWIWPFPYQLVLLSLSQWTEIGLLNELPETEPICDIVEKSPLLFSEFKGFFESFFFARGPQTSDQIRLRSRALNGSACYWLSSSRKDRSRLGSRSRVFDHPSI